jgi:hypothetical protein
MMELDDLRDHLERYRAVTLQCLDLLADEDLGWRPGADSYTLGQQFLHIAQSEDFQIRGVLFDEWDYERARFPEQAMGVKELRALLNAAEHPDPADVPEASLRKKKPWSCW